MPPSMKSTSQTLRTFSWSSTHLRIRPSFFSSPASRQCTRSPRPLFTSQRAAFTTSSSFTASKPPKSRDRGPKSSETTQTDFATLNVLGDTAAPASSIDACTDDGFTLNNQMRISGAGVMIVNGEVFKWRPWLREGRAEGIVGGGGTANDRAGLRSGDRVGTGKLRSAKGAWEADVSAWGLLDVVWPKPDLLIIGTGPNLVPISPATRKRINDLGIRVEIADTRNAAAQFNLLATERGVGQVAAAMVPIGWKEGR